MKQMFLVLALAAAAIAAANVWDCSVAGARPTAQQWEFRQLAVSYPSLHLQDGTAGPGPQAIDIPIPAEAAALGIEGWDLVGSGWVANRLLFTFKRPK